MQNYKITVSYDGTKYNGWQRQGNTKNTIQEKFENVLSAMCGESIEIHASGRTDAGVHALCQVANFKCKTEYNCNEVMDYLNKYLPEDILVTSVSKVHERFHARLNATAKTYEYSISVGKPDVFRRKYVYRADSVPDIRKMQNAAGKFLGTHDFKGFSSVKKTNKSTVRTISCIDITETDGIINITLTGTGFLYNMVRIICGTLYDIGTGKLSPDIIDGVFESMVRADAGTTLPPCGLKLVEVFY